MDQRERDSGIHGEGPSRLLCFPLTQAIARVHMPRIIEVQRLDHTDRYREMSRVLQAQRGDMMAIYQQEVQNLGSDILVERLNARARRQDFFSREDFLFGMYTMSILLVSQAQENLDMGDSGRYPEVTQASYAEVRRDHFDDKREEVYPLGVRERFRREMDKMAREDEFLRDCVHAVGIRSELHGDRELDFYGGAVFAYQLFRHAA